METDAWAGVIKQMLGWSCRLVRRARGAKRRAQWCAIMSYICGWVVLKNARPISWGRGFQRSTSTKDGILNRTSWNHLKCWRDSLDFCVCVHRQTKIAVMYVWQIGMFCVLKGVAAVCIVKKYRGIYSKGSLGCIEKSLFSQEPTLDPLLQSIHHFYYSRGEPGARKKVAN